MKLPFVEKPSFTIGRLDREGLEEKHFDPVNTACFLDDWQVDEYCANFFGWRYDLRKHPYTDSKGRDCEWYSEAWLNPKGKGTYRSGGDDIKPPPFRTRKWGEVLAYCVEQGWKPEMIEKVDEKDGKLKYGMILHGIDGLTKFPMTPHKGDSICRAFLAAAWTLQEAEAPQESVVVVPDTSSSVREAAHA